MKKIIMRVLLVVLCFTLAGCAGSSGLIRKTQKGLGLKPGEGCLLFPISINSNTNFWPQYLHLQEVNQYKEYNKKIWKSFPLSALPRYESENRRIYLLCGKIPSGTYKISHIGGLVGGVFFGTEFNVPYNRLVDISPGRVNYIGRLEYEAGEQGLCAITEDFYDTDKALFLENYTALQEERIGKDLIY